MAAHIGAWLLFAALGLAWPATAAVCGDEQGVPCFKLAGGTSLPQVAMGTWGGSYKGCDRADYACIRMNARYAAESWLHMGGTHLDGANDYRSQTSIAEALVSSGVAREEVFITTKCPGTIGYAAMMQCADDNLQMLGQFGPKGVAYIDLLLIHFPGVGKPECRFLHGPECGGLSSLVPPTKAELQETWRAMEDLKKFGVVKALGVSNYNITHLNETLENASEPIEVNQVEWNPKFHDEEMLSFCQKHSILLEAWSPLGGAHGSVLGDDSVKKIAAAHNVSTAQVVLRWSVQRGVAVVVGTANADHAASDKDIFSFNLTDDEVKVISSLQNVRSQPSQPVLV